MLWLQRFFAPRNRPFIIYVALVAVLAAGALWYKGGLKTVTLAQVSSSVRRAVTDANKRAKLKMERSTLEFELPNVRRGEPLLGNAELAAEWREAAVRAQLDPEVCQRWRGYLGQVAPLVREREAGLEAFLTLEQGYELEVERLAREVFEGDKLARLMNLRTNRFAALFSEGTYWAEQARFAKAEEKLEDADALALGAVYETALERAVTNLDAGLTGYGGAWLRCELKSNQIKNQLREIREQLGETEQASVARLAPGEPLPTPEAMLSRGFFQTYVPQPKDFATAGLATIVLGWLLTWPLELRDRRWLKIAASIALVFGALLCLRIEVRGDLEGRGSNVFGFLGFLGPAAVLAAVWAPTCATLCSMLLLQLIDPAGPSESEGTELHPAYEAARRGESRLALKLLKPRLLLEPWHYEALTLKAKLQRQLKGKWRARRTLAKLLRNPQLSALQRDSVEHMLGSLDDGRDPVWSFLRQEKPRQEEVAPFDF